MVEDTSKEVAEWIDAGALADVLLEALEDNDIEPTVDNAKKLWLDILENGLADTISSSIKYSPKFK